MKSLSSSNHPLQRKIESVFFPILLLFFFFDGSCAFSQTEDLRGGNFTLQSEKNAVSLSDFRGKVVVIYFGYTSCGAVCPMSVAQIGGALKQLGAEERKRAAGIFITIDPERDTPEAASQYASQFDPLIVGLSGKMDDIRKVAKQYGVKFEKVGIKSSMDYSCDHTSETYIVNPAGKLVSVLPHGVSSSTILEEIKKHTGK